MYFCTNIQRTLLLKGLHIILAFFIFFSSSGFVLNKHFCQGELKSMSFFVKAKPCHQTKQQVLCPIHAAKANDTAKKKKDCCKDESDFLKSGHDQYAFESGTVDLHFMQAFCAFASPLVKLPAKNKKTVDYLNYKPPLIVCDLPVRLQTFLC